ncbi:MAG: hypothetical protein ACJ8LL_13660 [Candidatus Udaeobacter sp.]
MKTLHQLSRSRAFTHVRILAAIVLVLTAVALVFLSVSPPAVAQPRPRMHPLTPTFSKAVAFDVSPAVRTLKPIARPRAYLAGTMLEIRPESEGPAAHRAKARGLDGALQLLYPTPTIPAPLLTFEGLSNQDNFNRFGGRVNPPDPNGEVGPNNFVEMINLLFAVYDKAGNLLAGPFDTGSLFAGFPIANCSLNAGDPVVLYDQFKDRWLLSQFTPSNSGPEFWNCVAISTTSDPTGSYYRYAFSTGPNFPDYPKYGNWTDSYVITTREFGPTIEYGIGVYALEKNKMTDGDPNARSVRFFIDGNDPDLLPLVGDGLLPADVDGKQKPKTDTAIPIIGTQDDTADYGATFDAINIFDLTIKWRSTPIASLQLNTQLPTAPFDSIFPCGPDSRDCLPQPGITNPAQFLDILSYRQRPTFRLAYRNFKTYESLVTNQSVEATPGVAGARWYEVRRDGNGVYSLYQQGTYDPGDGVHRWMGSVAMDKKGNMALGYSVVNGTTVYPGIRYTGRLAGDPLGQMTLGEGTIVDGTGVQRTTNSRWGDYTDITVDPTDDCTFWYVDEYYTLAGQQSSTAGWQTRIGSFKLPGCQ